MIQKGQKTRRAFIAECVVASAVAASASGVIAETTAPHPDAVGAPSFKITKIKALARRDETILRLGGTGAFPCLTWSADDRQIGALEEGANWPGLPKDTYFTAAAIAVDGRAENVTFQALPGYPIVPFWESWRVDGAPTYVGVSILSVGSSIYQYLSSARHNSLSGEYSSWGKCGVKLIYSPDNGQTWFNQNGTTPVVREGATQRSAKTMVFWDEIKGVDSPFVAPRFVQMGRAYELNRDGYVYAYSSSKTGVMMFRVPKAGILDKTAYEYFASRSDDGSVKWVRDFNSWAPMLSIPKGWGIDSIVYNAALDLYMMTGSKGTMIAPKELYEPSSLGIWMASNPWGPWDQVHEEAAWLPGGHPSACAANPVIAPKWISEDGKSFWLVFTDLVHSGDFRQELQSVWFHARSEKESNRLAMEYCKGHPYYRFCVQRVDIVTA